MNACVEKDLRQMTMKLVWFVEAIGRLRDILELTTIARAIEGSRKPIDSKISRPNESRRKVGLSKVTSYL